MLEHVLKRLHVKSFRDCSLKPEIKITTTMITKSFGIIPINHLENKLRDSEFTPPHSEPGSPSGAALHPLQFDRPASQSSREVQ